ncbi:maleylpyruvate isomerase N-terminal domain-containing protein [Mycolicibacterium mucogenicum]
MDRIVELVSAPDVSVDAPVAACPGWSVRDVLAHMAGVAQDWAAGRRVAPQRCPDGGASGPVRRARPGRHPAGVGRRRRGAAAARARRHRAAAR